MHVDTRPPVEMAMSITDVSDTQAQTLYIKGARISGRTVQRVITLQVANRTWRITFKAPASALVAVTGRLAPVGVLVGGVVLILAAGVLFYTLELRNRLKCMVTS